MLTHDFDALGRLPRQWNTRPEAVVDDGGGYGRQGVVLLDGGSGAAGALDHHQCQSRGGPGLDARFHELADGEGSAMGAIQPRTASTTVSMGSVSLRSSCTRTLAMAIPRMPPTPAGDREPGLIYGIWTRIRRSSYR